MSSLLPRLLGQAEASVADAARRAIDSVTAPLIQKSQTLATETMDAASRSIKLVVIKAVLGLVAAGMAIVAVVYALGALYDALLPMLGPVEAKLAMAGAFALIALIAVLAMVFWPKGSAAPKAVSSPTPAADARKAETRRDEARKDDARKALDQARTAATDAGTAAKKAAKADSLDDAAAAAGAAPVAGLASHVDTIVDVLGEAGFHREKAGLRAGLALASQLKPMQIVGLALIGGFVAGMRTPGRR